MLLFFQTFGAYNVVQDLIQLLLIISS